jgi:transcriptional regulator with XRE-family HTH domain
MAALANRIRDWRGSTPQLKACGKLGVSQGTLSEWESGAVVPSNAHLRRIAKVLRVPLGTLLVEASDAALARARASQQM